MKYVTTGKLQLANDLFISLFTTVQLTSNCLFVMSYETALLFWDGGGEVWQLSFTTRGLAKERDRGSLPPQTFANTVTVMLAKRRCTL